MSASIRFIVITTPPSEVERRIDGLRRTVNRIGGCRSALAYPPHVTLRTGALVPAVLVSRFLDSFGAAVGRWTPFPIRTDGIWQTSYRDRDQEKFLVGYRICKDEPLAELNERLLRCATWRASDRRHFEPHLTLAFDDLDREGSGRVIEWMRENPAEVPPAFEWSCTNVALYCRDGEEWTPYKVWRQ